MNRKLLPEYLGLAEKYRLRIVHLARQTDENAVIHPDLHRRHPTADTGELKTVNFLIKLEKPQ